MGIKIIYGFLITLLIVSIPAWAQEPPGSDDIITKMRTQLDLSEEQIFNITPIIEKYVMEFHDLQQSIKDGTMNPSAIDSQKQGIEAAETQELSPYLKPYQLSEWRHMQSQMDQQQGTDDNSDEKAESDQYSNLPNNPSAQ